MSLGSGWTFSTMRHPLIPIRLNVILSYLASTSSCPEPGPLASQTWLWCAVIAYIYSPSCFIYEYIIYVFPVVSKICEFSVYESGKDNPLNCTDRHLVQNLLSLFRPCFACRQRGKEVHLPPFRCLGKHNLYICGQWSDRILINGNLPKKDPFFV